MISTDGPKSHTWDESPKGAADQGDAFTENGRTAAEQTRNVSASCKTPETAHTGRTETGTARRYAPATCPLCEYDRRFPGFEAGGWMQQDNNGPIVSCPLCNPDGRLTGRP